jgi:hypothetical protein
MLRTLFGIFMLQNNENYASWVGDERFIANTPFTADLGCFRKQLTQIFRVPTPPFLHCFLTNA